MNKKEAIRRGKTNKKAAFEMSITTIIIIVISVVMLILGLVFVRTIMCGAMNIAQSTLEGAQKEINNLFGQEQGKELTCTGAKTTGTVAIVPGNYNVVACGFKPEVNKKYTYTFKIDSATAIDGTKIDTTGWVQESLTGTVNVGPGDIGYASFAIRPPEEAPAGSVIIKFDARDDKGKVFPTQTIRLTIKRLGWLQQTVC